MVYLIPREFAARAEHQARFAKLLSFNQLLATKQINRRLIMSYITVKGTGTVKQAPDIFGISLVVKAHKWEYADALKTLNEKVERVRKAV